MKSKKQQAVDLLAQAMVGSIVKLAKENLKVRGIKNPTKTELSLAVEAAMDAYEPHRVLLDEISDKVIDKLFKQADHRLKESFK